MTFTISTLQFIGSDGLLEESKLQQCVESSFAVAAAGSGVAANAQWPELQTFVQKLCFFMLLITYVMYDLDSRIKFIFGLRMTKISLIYNSLLDLEMCFMDLLG